MATSMIPYRLPFLEGLPVFAGCSWAVIGPFASK